MGEDGSGYWHVGAAATRDGQVTVEMFKPGSGLISLTVNSEQAVKVAAVILGAAVLGETSYREVGCDV